MGFRSILRRVRKPAVMALVAGSLALSLTVTTTQKAEAVPGVAVAPVIAAAEGVLAGGVRLALPSLLSIAIATTPVGWVVAGGLAIGALGVGLYSTRDYWVPFVTGAFGGAKDDFPATVAGGPSAPAPSYFSGLTISAVQFPAPTSPRALNITLSYPNNVSGNFSVAALLTCKKADGTTYNLGTGVGIGLSNVKTATNYVQCTTSGETLLGYRIGAPGSDPSLPSRTTSGTLSWSGPTNIRQGGTLLQGGFDPKGGDVKYKTTAECIDDGGNKTSITAEWFGDEGGAKVPSCAAAGKGHNTGKIGIEGYAPTAPGVPGTVPQPVWERTAPTTDPDHPLCGPQRPGPGCEMKILIDGKPCTIGAWECENWAEIWNDPTTAPRVGCTYGPYTLAVDLCRIMEPAYRPGGAPATEQNMDADPATRNYTQPGGTTYAPPSTGTGLVPGAAGSPAAGSTPEQAQCFPSGWAMLNPIEWVMKPVGCALDAAFKPKKDLQTRLAGMQGQFANKVPMSWFGVGMEGVSGGACPADWAVNFDGHRYSLICGTEADNIIRGFRPVLGAMLIMAMLMPLVRNLWYAAIPVFKVTPS